MTYAEDVNFWKTGKSQPDSWIEKAKKQIELLGGMVKAEGFGSNSDGKAAYMLGVEIKGDKFKVVWPVLESCKGDQRAAKVQAATSLYHYIKMICLYAVVVGPRVAFFSHMLLPDGRMAAEISGEDLASMTPEMLMIPERKMLALAALKEPT